MDRRSRGLESDLRRLAAQQHGVVSRRQAAELGLTRGQVDGLVASGRWRSEGRRALVLEGAPPGQAQTCAIVLHRFGPRAVLSHQSAAAIWDLSSFRLSPIHVLVPYGTATEGQPQVVVHRARRLLPHHVTEVDGLRVTTPARTIFDLSGVLTPRWRVERTLDEAWGARLVTYRSMRRMVDEERGRGQRNIGELREVLDARGPHHIPAQSALERRFHRIIRDDGQEPLTPQVDITDEEGWWGRVDAVDHEAALVVEIDGERWHRTLTRQRDDDQRRARWRAMGFTVLAFSEHDVWYRPEKVATAVRRARAEGRARRSAA